MRYPCIVIDPPWEQRGGPGFDASQRSRSLPYPTMPLDDIAALPVAALAADDAHLWIWVTNRYLRHVWDLAEGWGFRPVTLLTWTKEPMGTGLGGRAFGQTSEYALYCTRGTPEVRVRQRTTWWAWRRPYNAAGKPDHSRKPEGLMDVAEQVAPGPRLEMFARRQRLGWDTWGNQALEHVAVGGAA